METASVLIATIVLLALMALEAALNKVEVVEPFVCSHGHAILETEECDQCYREWEETEAHAAYLATYMAGECGRCHQDSAVDINTGLCDWCDCAVTYEEQYFGEEETPDLIEDCEDCGMKARSYIGLCPQCWDWLPIPF